MNKQELSKAIAQRTGLAGEDAAAALDAMLDAIIDGLERGDAISIRGFGTISAKTKPARAARGFAKATPKRRTAQLKPSSTLEARLNRSEPETSNR